MLSNIFKKLFGSRNDRVIKQLKNKVSAINALETEIQSLSDDELKAKTDEFKERHANGESLEKLLPEAFAVVREASVRVLGMRHFDVQMIGGMVLQKGQIAEMRTGEGKTLVATLSCYLNALAGKGVHVITVNDYLAQRDAEWMGQLYQFLGMSTGVIIAGLPPEVRKEAYASDITYGTNNEFGFDYLRDNMAFSSEEKVQRELNFAIVDEVDSILIDEARTPLIISGPTDDNSELYLKINKLVPQLTPQVDEESEGDYLYDEKSKQVHLSEQGHEHVENMLLADGTLAEGESLYDSTNINIMHHFTEGLRAHVAFKRDVDYVVKNNQVVIVDEFTGRTMEGRRWSGGLHQAIEAKEGVEIQNENQTLASITFQNYFRLYNTLSGMTGTADTEAFEFQQIYGLEVVVIPTNNPMIRDDRPDLVYLTEREKLNAIIEDIRETQKTGQPILVGTASIEASEVLSQLMDKEGLKHAVLNAKQHEREAYIIEQAGVKGTVTIATNMAGRGTDIMLGGNLKADIKELGDNPDPAEVEKLTAEWNVRHQEILKLGGLHIIGTERHESRRIDNQLRGRSGRQGDPGSSRFYLSLEDSLMRIFASERVSSLMQKLGMEEGEAIEHRWVTKAIENAQRKVEGRNFDIRKNLLEFDDVANDQRKVIYEQRNELMGMDDISEMITAIREDVVNDEIDLYIPHQSMEEQWDVPGLEESIKAKFAVEMPLAQWLEDDPGLHEESLRRKIIDELVAVAAQKEAAAGSEVVRHFEKAVMLQILDSLWKEHLASMDYLRQGIHLRGYAQKDPKQEYKREAFELFESLLVRIKQEVIKVVSNVQVNAEEDVQAVEEQRRQTAEMDFSHPEAGGYPVADNAMREVEESNEEQERPTTFVRNERKVGRNEPCPCGSGKKYKQCHGKIS